MGYAPKSAVERQISDGSQYDKYFPEPQGKVILLKKNGNTQDTIKYMIKMVRDYSYQTRKISKVLAVYNADDTLNIYKTVKKVYDFVCKYIKYNIEDGEQLQQPAHTWHQAQVLARQHPENKTYSADCDCMSIFCACVFHNLRIPNVSFKIAGYSIIGGYQHVYCVVKTDKGEIICDPVYWQFNAEKDPIKQKEFAMSTLSGTDIYMLAGIDGAEKKLSYPIANRYVEQSDGSLGLLGGKKKKAEKKAKKAKKKEGKKEKKAAKKEIKSARKEKRQAKKSGDSAALAKAKAKLESAKQKKQEAKEKIDENRTGIAKAMSKAGKFVKSSALLPARAPFLLLMRLNFRGMAAKLANNKTAYDKFMRIWKNLGGKEKKLANAIEKGKGKKPMFGSKKTKGNLKGQLGEIGEVMYGYGMLTDSALQSLGYLGLGFDPVTAASTAIAAATPIIKKVMNVLKQVGDFLPESGDGTDESELQESDFAEEDPDSDDDEVIEVADYELVNEEPIYYDNEADGDYYDENYQDETDFYEEDERDYEDESDYDDDFEGLGYIYVDNIVEPDGTLGKGWFKKVWQNGKSKVKKLLKPSVNGLGKTKASKSAKKEKKKAAKAQKKTAKTQKKATKSQKQQQKKDNKAAKKTAKKETKAVKKQQKKADKAVKVVAKKQAKDEKKAARQNGERGIKTLVNKAKESKVVQQAMTYAKQIDDSDIDNETTKYIMDNSKTIDSSKGTQSATSSKPWVMPLAIVAGLVVVGGIGYAIYSSSKASSTNGMGYIKPMKLS